MNEPLDPNRLTNGEIEDLAYIGDPEGHITTEGRPLSQDYLDFRARYEAPEMHMSEEEQQILRETRAALTEIVQDSLTTTLKANAALDRIEQLPALPSEEKGEVGIVKERQNKRKAKEVKEAAPRQYSEMLVVANDMQLLKEADPEAIGAFMHYIEANKDRITHLVLNGDIADFSAQSFFDKDLETMTSASDEIESVRWLIGTLDKWLPKAKKVFIDGNHEARWTNMIDNNKGNEAWLRSVDEQFGLENWEHLAYGSGQFYQWHERIFWHGHRSSIHTAKAELGDAGTSVTTAHINRNQFYESTDARGNRNSGITHGGFSRDNLGFMKKAVTNWAQGFGVYFYDEKTQTEQPYMVTMSHGQPRFIGPDGVIYSGEGYNLREEIGLDPKPKRK